MVGSAFFFSVMSMLVKAAGRRLPSQEIVLSRGVINMAITYGLVRAAGVSPWGNRRWILILRGVFGFIALSCFYFALTRLPLAETTVLQYTSPIWTALIAAWWLDEGLTMLVVGSILVSFVGVTLISRPGFLFGGAGAELDLFAVGVALFGALMSGCAYVSVREASKTEHPLVIVFYFTLVTVAGSTPWAATEALWPHGWEWAALVGVGLTTQAGQIYLTRGLSLEPAGRAMAIGYLQILFAAVWGVFFFAEYPDLWSIAGSILVVGGTLAIGLVRRGLREAEPTTAAAEGPGRAEAPRREP